MSTVKTTLSRLKWRIINSVICRPIQKLLEILPLVLSSRVLQEIDIVRALDYGKVRLLLRVHSVSERSRLRSCAKEPRTVRWLEANTAKYRVFYDIGANVGAYSLIAASTAEDMKVFAFEPSFSTYGSLVRNTLLNRLEHRVHTYPIALSNHTGESRFHMSSMASGAAEHSVDRPIDMYGKVFTPMAVYGVLTFEMDAFRSMFGLPCPEFLKIDVDGNEVEVLRGAAQTLSDTTLRSILVEVREESDMDSSIRELLAKYNFLHTGTGYATSPGFANLEFERAGG
jgi:FkbM family methyltransferase